MVSPTSFQDRPDGTFWARFDDLQCGEALLFSEPHTILTAAQPSEVKGVFTSLEAAAEAGDWAFGYVTYEAAPGLNSDLAARASSGPLVWFGLCPPPRRIRTIAVAAEGPSYQLSPWKPNWNTEGYRSQLGRIHEQIALGETYQINLTGRLLSRVAGDYLGLYADLAHRQRGKYACYLDTGRNQIVSASPELFFSLSGDRLTMRPMKGTAARGRTTAEDEDRRSGLLGSAKERAENIMIVDLLRNDLNRLAVDSHVRATAICTAERFETVWQLTSDVQARVQPSITMLEIFGALFPSGSVTGAPKIASMRLIAELEPAARGVYCGAIGFVGPRTAPIRARFSVAIRTAVIETSTGAASYGTGGAITWSSDPDAEQAELLAKAAILNQRPSDFELLETFAQLPGNELRNVDRHVARMLDSATYFGFCLDVEAIHRLLSDLPAANAPHRIRLLAARNGTLRLERSLLAPERGKRVGLAVDGVAIDSAQPWFFHKTTRRTAYTERKDRHPEADDVVLINEHGQLTETTIANLALKLGRRWYTPPLDSGCLPGVARGLLIDSGRLFERGVDLADLHAATGVAVVSSLRGWRPAALYR